MGRTANGADVRWRPLMRRLLLIFLMVAAAGEASATAGHEEYTAPGGASTNALTCAAVQSFVNGRGATILADGHRPPDRYVRDQSFCYWSQHIAPAFAQARDDPQCFVGYVCRERGEFWSP